MSLRPCQEGSWLWESGRPGNGQAGVYKTVGPDGLSWNSVEQVMSNELGGMQTFREQSGVTHRWAGTVARETAGKPRGVLTYIPRKSFNREKVTKYAQCCQEIKEEQRGASLVLRELRVHTPNAGSLGSIPGQGTGSLRLQLTPSTAQ